VQRRENACARQEGQRPRTLAEWDFLLGVHDETRLGALRFKLPDGPYVDSDTKFAAPPLTSRFEESAFTISLVKRIDRATAKGKDRIRQRVMLTAPRALGTVCEQRSSADHAFAVIKLPRSLHRNSKDERTVKTASLKPVSDNGLQRPLGLLGQIRSGTHPGQEHATPSKAEYIAADLSSRTN
jgi:hypothetical protein